MFCKYCGKEIDDNSAFCKYCGKSLKMESDDSDDTISDSDMRKYAKMGRATISSDLSEQTFTSTKEVTNMFSSPIFVIITVLMCVYILLRLFGSSSVLTKLLAIPTIIICIGCWVAFVQARRDRITNSALMAVRCGLVIQMTCFIVEGIVVFIVALDSFGGFLKDLSNFSGGYDDLSELILTVIICAVLIVVCGAALVDCLDGTRRGVVSAQKTFSGSVQNKKSAIKIQRITGLTAFAAVCCVCKIIFAEQIYEFFAFVFYPRMTLLSGTISNLFSGSLGSSLNNLLNKGFNLVRNDSDGWFKDQFLGSMQGTSSNVVATVILIAILICLICLLVKIRRERPQAGGRRSI